MRAAVHGPGFLLPLGAGGVAAGVTVYAVAATWRACDVGNDSANGMILLLLFPVLWGVFAAAVPRSALVRLPDPPRLVHGVREGRRDLVFAARVRVGAVVGVEVDVVRRRG